MSRVVDSSVETVEERQLKDNAVAEYQEQEEAKQVEVFESDVAGDIRELYVDMGQLKEFENRQSDLNYALEANGLHFDDVVEFKHLVDEGADGYVELQKLKDKAQSNLNHSIGTKLESTAGAMLKMIDEVFESHANYGETTF